MLLNSEDLDMKRFLSVVLVAFAITGCSDDNSVGVEEFASDVSFSRDSDDSRIRVMTRNLYIGTSTSAVVMSPPAQIPLRVAEAFQVFLSSSFAERMAALAEEIADARPHLVGLQEVTLMRLQSPGDLVLGGQTLPEKVIADFEVVLLSDLAALGLDYRIVARIQNTDVELPMFVPRSEGFPFDDLRFTDFDMILARGDVGISNVTEQNFVDFLNPGFDLLRGWVAVDATVRGRTFRFVNTHLEAFDPGVRMAQANELVQSLAAEVHPVIAVGDFNTEATGAAGATYQFLSGAGYEDVWPLSRPRGDPGFTCCHPDDLALSPLEPFDERIDLIFVRNAVGPFRPHLRRRVSAEVVGEELDDRILLADGRLIWPSDHAGVVARLDFRLRKSDKSDKSGKSDRSGKSDKSES